MTDELSEAVRRLIRDFYRPSESPHELVLGFLEEPRHLGARDVEALRDLLLGLVAQVVESGDLTEQVQVGDGSGARHRTKVAFARRLDKCAGTNRRARNAWP